MSEEITLVVCLLSGEHAWGPDAVQVSRTVADLQQMVAMAIRRPVILIGLSYNDVKLQPESSLREVGVKDGSEIQLVMRGGLVEECMAIVESEEWQDTYAHLIYECLYVLPFWGDAENTERCTSLDLLVKCLSQEMKDEEKYPEKEKFPDKLTWKAAQLLPVFAKAEDDRVKRLCNQWLLRLADPYALGRCVTPSLVTMHAMLKVIPHIVPGDPQCTRTLIDSVTGLVDNRVQMCTIRPRPYSREIVACWKALLRLMNSDDPESVAMVREHFRDLRSWVPKNILQEDEGVWSALADLASAVGMQDDDWFANTGIWIPDFEPLWPQNQKEFDILMTNPIENEWWPGGQQ